jgi:hypothetical protein
MVVGYCFIGDRSAGFLPRHFLLLVRAVCHALQGCIHFAEELFVDKGSCHPSAAGNIRVRFFVDKEKKEIVKPMEDQID